MKKKQFDSQADAVNFVTAQGFVPRQNGEYWHPTYNHTGARVDIREGWGEDGAGLPQGQWIAVQLDNAKDAPIDWAY